MFDIIVHVNYTLVQKIILCSVQKNKIVFKMDGQVFFIFYSLLAQTNMFFVYVILMG